MEYGEFNSINTSLVEYERTTKRVPTMKSLDAKKGENKAEKASSAAAEAPAAAVSVSAPSVQLDLSKVKIEPLFADDLSLIHI